MVQQDILIVITSALFAGGDGKKLDEVSSIRCNRLRETISSLAKNGFKNFVVLDHTLPGTFQLQDIMSDMTVQLQVIKGEAPPVQFPSNEYQVNGPSRLEAVLLYQCLPELRNLITNYGYILKVSAGYQVKNLNNILARATNGIVYRMGNPFRRRIKFCLTSFYILPSEHFVTLCAYLYAQVPEMSNIQPLEFHMYRYVKSVSHQLLAISYPKLKANFLSSGKSAEDLAYRVRELVFRLLAKLGLYAYQFQSLPFNK